jgi:exosortase/archaeosortase family protein
VIFLVISCAAFFLEYLWKESDSIRGIRTVYASISGVLAGGFVDGVIRTGTQLAAGEHVLDVTPECAAVSATAMFCAAVLGMPGSRFSKLTGLMVGVVGVGLLNLIRLSVLTIIAEARPSLFQFAHNVLMQGFLIIMVGPLFLAWAVWAFRRDRRSNNLEVTSNDS